ncbi:hypothetical protein [Pseudonocardia spinosispora]|nr:hypothetical protein [Pseudonocardia spinosispora]
MSTPEPPLEPAEGPRPWLSVDWIAVIVAGVLVVAVGTGLLPVIPW